jgi:hypothetical protein
MRRGGMNDREARRDQTIRQGAKCVSGGCWFCIIILPTERVLPPFYRKESSEYCIIITPSELEFLIIREIPVS